MKIKIDILSYLFIIRDKRKAQQANTSESKANTSESKANTSEKQSEHKRKAKRTQAKSKTKNVIEP